MNLIEYLEKKEFNSFKVVLFFAGLTVIVTAVVIVIWEKLLLVPFNSLMAAYYTGDSASLYYFQQRGEHFIISTTVDVLIVTLLLRIVSRQQHQLAASEKRYRSLFEHASDGIGVVTASDYRFVEVNNKFCDILGCQPKEFVGKDIRELLRADGDGSRPDLLQELLGGETSAEVEMTIRTPGGASVSAAVSSSKLKTDGEQLVILIIHDLSERRRMQAEKEEMQRQLFQSSKLASIGELSAGVAHEINNPLNGIINFAQLLKDDEVARTDDQKLMINGIIDEGERIARIVRDLLTFARLDPHELTHVRVAETINASISLFGHQLKKDGIAVEIDVEENLPPVMADGSRLRQVVVNMISNAHHALREKPEGPKLFRATARAVAGPGGARVRLEFFDNGVGIRREDTDKVFDPFFTTRRAS
ncbi:MAG TPA: histidine kinase dimerization/phospho-acceptor domain-containing protein, partial [Pyrinomonadaceae bacterium]|nr:histidine kinase dimerization/phospho-acceptor domain-containing protein [Pyrinomonadaceae bacterium]